MEAALAASLKALARYAMLAFGSVVVMSVVPDLAKQLERSPLRPVLRLMDPRRVGLAAADLAVYFASAHAFASLFPDMRRGFTTSAAAAVSWNRQLRGVSQAAHPPLVGSAQYLWASHWIMASFLSRAIRDVADHVGDRSAERLTHKAVQRTVGLGTSLFTTLGVMSFAWGIVQIPAESIAPWAVLLGQFAAMRIEASLRGFFPVRDPPVNMNLLVVEEDVAALSPEQLAGAEQMARVVIQAQRVRHSSRAAALRFLTAAEAFRGTSSTALPVDIERALTHMRFADVASTAISASQSLFRTTQCSICLDDYMEQDDVTAVRCGHVLHTVCLRTWLLSRKTECPVCRTDVRASRVQDIGAGDTHRYIRKLLASWTAQRLPPRIERSSWREASDYLCLRARIPRRVTQQLPDGLYVVRDDSWVTRLIWSAAASLSIATHPILLL